MTVSWLDLERYVAGDLEPERRRRVETALSADPALRARLAGIEADDRPIPPLPGLVGDGPLPPDSGAPLPEPHGEGTVIPLRRRPVGVAVSVLLAAAVALAVIPLREPGLSNDGRLLWPASSTTWKGGELSLRLDRERQGRVRADAARFQDGDRFVVRLTCPAGRRSWDARVFQGGRRYAPLPVDGPVDCGNAVRLPGAFAPTGADAVTVCVAVGAAAETGALDGAREELADVDGVVCARLEPGG
ncbi:MAG: hypothetical protein D6798_08550 [Deltaproteobacteria bacterium]|nr:MAG: hypothetical protein D6798_08550 [Deltaproteobacteria bacterium]